MTKPAAQNLGALLSDAQRVGFGSQREMGDLAGASRNTVARWQWNETSPSPEQIAAIARHVCAHDPELAAKLAAHAGATLESLGLVAKPAPPPPPSPSPRHLANGVLCAVAEAADSSPNALRPLLVVAFEAARAAGLSVEDMLRGLRDERPAKEPVHRKA